MQNKHAESEKCRWRGEQKNNEAEEEVRGIQSMRMADPLLLYLKVEKQGC